MKANQIIILFFILLLGCNKDVTITNNTLNITPDYKLNLSCDDCGINKYNVNISWSSYILSDFGSYSIFYNNNENIITDSTISTYTINMNPGELKNITFKILDDNDEVLYINSIQIFSRNIYPITWKKIEPDSLFNHNLEWNISNEPVSEFLQYKIFRSSESNSDIYDCSNCIEIATITDRSINTYFDTTTTGQAHTYRIATIDTTNNYQESTLDNSIYAFSTPNAENITDLIATNNFEDFIRLEWNKPQNVSEFYSLELWRGSDQWINFNPSQNTKLVTITNLNDFNDFEKMYFEDRFEIGSGTTWYYRLKITNIYNMYEQSNIVDGITKL